MKSKELLPYENRILIEPKESELVSAGGIFKPDSDREKSNLGVVKAVGPGLMKVDGTRVPMSTKIGDIVAYPKFGPQLFEYENEEYIIIKESELLIKVVSNDDATDAGFPDLLKG